MRRFMILAAAIAGFALAPAAGAVETRSWVVDTAAELLGGRGDNVEVTADGLLRPVPGWIAGPELEEPVVMAAAAADGAVVVGTSHPARLYRVTESSKQLLAEIPAEQVTAVASMPGGGLVVATVAPAAVFRWRGGELTEAGRLADGGLWDVAVFGGVVVVAGGPPATLYRLREHGLERWRELPDVHASCLAVDGDRLLVGTSEQGLILSVDGAGVVGVVADSPFTEISDLAVGGGGVWATALVGEPVRPAPSNGTQKDDDNEGSVTVKAEVGGASDLELPKVNGKTATSEVLKLTAAGGLISLHRFVEQVASSAAWDGGGLLVGTGYEGEVWRFVDGGGSRIASVDAVQVVEIVDGGAILLTQGPAGTMWPNGERPARFRSATEKYSQPVRFGEYRVEPPVPGASIRFRSGISTSPDATWLPWTEWKPAASGLVGLPPSRAVQWELELSAKDSALVDRVEVAVVEVNLPPALGELTVEQPGVVYLASPPTSGPVIEAVHPNLDGIFTVIDESAKKAASTKGKKYYRAGYRTVSWKAEDGNQDPLRFRLEVENREGHRLEVRDRITGHQLGVDTTALPDGWYRFRLTATDAARNPVGALETTRVSGWFAVDNTPPRIELERDGGEWTVTVTDALSPVVRAEWSRDGGRWQPLPPADGLLDGREERFEFTAAEGEHLVVVRAVDRHHNRATAGASEK